MEIRKESNNTAKTISLVMVIMFFGKVSGFCRDIVFNQKIGPTTDAMSLS